LELGSCVAEKYSKQLHNAFISDADVSSKHLVWKEDNPPRPICVDARYIILTYKAALFAASAFHNPKGLLLTLLQDFAVVVDGDFGVNNRWLLKDVLAVVSIASITEEERECTAGLFSNAIREWRRNFNSTVAIDILEIVLDASPSILQHFRSQLLSKLPSADRLRLLAGEEVTCHFWALYFSRYHNLTL
jgi:hypothetical protein